MKICVLGNSHVASLKQGWDQLSTDYPGFELTFFASRQNGLRGLRLDGQSLVPSTPALTNNIAFTSGGKEAVVLADYDVFLTYGLGLSVPLLTKSLSSAVKSRTCLDAFERSLSSWLCRLIRKGSDAPIYIGHNPQRALRKEGFGESSRCDYEEVFGVMSAKHGLKGVSLIPQPLCTLANGWNTRMEFSSNSTRLDVGDKISNALHDDGDLQHMNGVFGKIYLQELFQVLST
jgi:hypothetical protein